jgi:hypothetical protein
MRPPVATALHPVMLSVIASSSAPSPGRWECSAFSSHLLAFALSIPSCACEFECESVCACVRKYISRQIGQIV